MASSINRVVFISDFFPRRCGIATFTYELCNSITESLKPGAYAEVVAIDETPESYQYPDCVRFQINENIRNDYVVASEFINIIGYDLAIVQHEYGIYGGEDGNYLIHLLRRLNMPVLTTLHTVLTEPSKGQREVLIALAELSDYLVVMSHKAVKILKEVYGISEDKVSFIPHGIPDIPFSDPSFHKDSFGVENQKLILTFGLIGPSKGLEKMIDAMPAIVEQHPDAVYLILGATHPHIIRDSGESYRRSLVQRAKRLGVEKNILFHNRFVSMEVLVQYLSAADIYCTPYPNMAQITSGTLAYALGSGKAVVSTPYWYAEELLADGRGELVDFEDTESFSNAINMLLNDDGKRNTMRKKAYQFCRSMVWSKVAADYIALGESVIAEQACKPKPRSLDTVDVLEELPVTKLQHLKILTDDTGILQHAFSTTPNRHHGYCLDDNARALIVTCLQYKQEKDDSLLSMIHTYLSFIQYAFNTETRRYRNFMSFHRTWLEDEGSEDSHSRAVWALGVAVKYAPVPSIGETSARMFTGAIEKVESFKSPRAIAFSLIGIHAYLEIYAGDSDIRRIRNSLAEKLYKQFKENANDDWPWMEDSVTYANGILPLALMLSGQWIPKMDMHEMGIKALRWLLDKQKSAQGHLSIIGNEDWMTRDGKHSTFDQQPIEPMCLILACCEAYRSTRDDFCVTEARRCLDWFLGNNDLNIPLCNFRTGGCRDGLHPGGASINQGAESTLAWLISLLAMHEINELSPAPKEKE